MKPLLSNLPSEPILHVEEIEFEAQRRGQGIQ